MAAFLSNLIVFRFVKKVIKESFVVENIIVLKKFRITTSPAKSL